MTETLKRYGRTRVSGISKMEVAVGRYDYDTMELHLGYLTPSELRVLYWLLRGYDNSTIGAILDVDEKTIERHINGIYSKTRLNKSETQGQNPRAALCWLCLRDSVYNFLDEDGVLSSLEDNLRGFSPKERLIVDLLKLGHGNSRIAEIVKLSESTVSWHVRSISFKVGLNGQFGKDTQAKRKELLARLK